MRAFVALLFLVLYALAVDVSFARLESSDGLKSDPVALTDPDSVVFLTMPGPRFTEPKLFREEIALLGNSTLRVIPYVLTPVGPTACNMGVFVDDGCQGAPAPLTASFGRSNVFTPGGYINTVAATTANYMATNCNGGSTSCRPVWNEAGNADDGYRIGYYSTLTQMNSPAYDPVNIGDPSNTLGFHVPGCTYTHGNGTFNTGGPSTAHGTTTGGNLLTCTAGGGFSGTLQHFNLGPTGGHNCTAVSITGTYASPGLIDDFYFQNDAGNCGQGQDVFNVAATFSAGLTVSNYEADGNWTAFSDIYGSASCAAAGGNNVCNPINLFAFGVFPTTIKYSASYHFPYFHVGANFAPVTMQYDWVEGWCYRGPNCHSEWWLGQGNSIAGPDQNLDHITVLGDKTQSGFGPTPNFITADYGVVMNYITMTKNVFIGQFTGGISAGSTTVSGCLGMPPTGGTTTSPTCAAGSGPIFYQTSTTPNVIGQGSILNNGCSGFGGGVIYKPIPGAYPISTTGPDIQAEWYIDNFTIGNTTATYAQGTLAGGAGTFVVTSTPCINSSVSGAPVTWSLLNGHGPNPVTQVTITNNLSDFSSSPSTQIYGLEGVIPQSFWYAVNGTDMLGVTQLGATTGNIIYSASLTDCATTLLSCPAMTSASGSYPSAGTPTGITVNGTAVNSGLISMTDYTPTTIASGSISGTSLTTGGVPLTVSAGDVIYDVINSTCSGAAPSTCPTVATACTSCTTIVINNPGGVTITNKLMTKLHVAANITGTINNAAPGAIGVGHILLNATNTTVIHIITGIGPFIGVPSCSASTNIIGCPQVNAGSPNTEYTLSISGGTVGGTNSFVAAQAHYPAWCLNPSVVNGNYDMANILTTLLLNPNWTTTPLPEQEGC